MALRPVLEDVRQLICSVLLSSLWDWGFSWYQGAFVYGNGATLSSLLSHFLWIDFGRDFYLTKCRVSTGLQENSLVDLLKGETPLKTYDDIDDGGATLSCIGGWIECDSSLPSTVKCRRWRRQG